MPRERKRKINPAKPKGNAKRRSKSPVDGADRNDANLSGILTGQSVTTGKQTNARRRIIDDFELSQDNTEQTDNSSSGENNNAIPELGKKLCHSDSKLDKIKNFMQKQDGNVKQDHEYSKRIRDDNDNADESNLAGKETPIRSWLDPRDWKLMSKSQAVDKQLNLKISEISDDTKDYDSQEHLNESFQMSVEADDDFVTGADDVSDNGIEEEELDYEDDLVDENIDSDHEMEGGKTENDTQENSVTNNENMSRLAEFERLKENPEVKKFMELVMGKEASTRKQNDVTENKRRTPVATVTKETQSQQRRTSGKQPKIKGNTLPHNYGQMNKAISPSMETIYVPALKKQYLNPEFKKPDHIKNIKLNQNKLISNISNCIDQIRSQRYPEDTQVRKQPDNVRRESQERQGEEALRRHRTNQEEEMRRQHQTARRLTDDVILQAERNRASIEAPAGTANVDYDNLVHNAGYAVHPQLSPKTQTNSRTNVGVPTVDLAFSDDMQDNMQISVHLDEAMINKIGCGKFVDVETLLPREKLLRSDDSAAAIEMVRKDGKTYLVASEGNKGEKPRVTGIRSWEKAFRIYAAVYSKINPFRAAEIYQYVHVINVAAAAYHWDNVAYYDYYFRKHMDKFPQRSWAKTHLELYTQAMRDPIPTKSANKSNKSIKEACWRFNKNQCRRSARDCMYDHRCSNCNSYGHSAVNCLKKGNGGNGGQNNTQNNNRNNGGAQNQQSNTSSNGSAQSTKHQNRSQEKMMRAKIN